MRVQVGRHIADWLEDARINPRPRLDYRVCRISNVEIGLAGVSIDDNLHRIANIIDLALAALRVGIVIAAGVTIDYPVKPAVMNDQIWIRILAEERGDRRHPFADVAAE